MIFSPPQLRTLVTSKHTHSTAALAPASHRAFTDQCRPARATILTAHSAQRTAGKPAPSSCCNNSSRRQNWKPSFFQGGIPSTSTAAPRRIAPVMVEGHQCHRVGHAHRRLLLGKAFIASSPNGRFVEGAAAITGKALSRIEVHGKNLFYFFSGRNSSSNGSGLGSATAVAGSTPPPAAAGPVVLSPEDEDPLAEHGELQNEDDESALPVSPAAPPITPSRLPTARAGSALAAMPQRPAGLLATLGRTAASAAAAAAAAAIVAGGSAGSGQAESSAASCGAENDGGDGSDSDDTVVVHVHFGMSGAFRTSLLPGPEPTPTTRLRLEHQPTQLAAHLSAMTVQHGGLELYLDKVSKLGPDPLRPGDDPECFWARVSSSRKPIGLLLMDQSAVAGIGNIYRAEILYKSRVHPEQPGNTISRATFDIIWGHCVELLQRGFSSGSILTVDPEDAKALGKPWTRRYIYNQRQCGRCKGLVSTWDMSGRTVYCCTTCQPLQLNIAGAAGHAAAAAAAGPSEAAGINKKTKSVRRPSSQSSSSRSSKQKADMAGAAAAGAAAEASDAAARQLLSPSRLKSMAAARVAKEFVSHCAPDDPDELQPCKMTCDQLRERLRGLNMDTRGNKTQLVARLEAAQAWMAPPADIATGAAAGADAAAAAEAATAGVGAAGLMEVDGSSNSSGDELDTAEGRLAGNLSVPPMKRRRVAPKQPQPPAAAAAAGSAAAAPVTPSPKPGKTSSSSSSRSRRRARSGAAAAAAGVGIASASAAAAEKAAAGENRAVEHVALFADEATEALMFGAHKEL